MKKVRFTQQIVLIGASAEQAINACTVQFYGFKGLLAPDKKFKSASQIFDEFTSLLKTQNVAYTFLVQGVSDPLTHLQELLARTTKFRILAKSRAGGLHAGYASK